MLFGWSQLYWFEGKIIDRERYTDVVLQFRVSLVLKGLIAFQLLLAIAVTIGGILTHQAVQALETFLAFSLFTLFYGFLIHLHKLRIKNNFAQLFQLTEGPF